MFPPLGKHASTQIGAFDCLTGASPTLYTIWKILLSRQLTSQLGSFLLFTAVHSIQLIASVSQRRKKFFSLRLLTVKPLQQQRAGDMLFGWQLDRRRRRRVMLKLESLNAWHRWYFTPSSKISHQKHQGMGTKMALHKGASLYHFKKLITARNCGVKDK